MTIVSQSMVVQGVQTPVPQLAVWFGSMPESNGKQNWTAMLHRKNESGFDSFTDGITLMRSEYHDRVRYEADRVRYLIGEISQQPDILTYDGNLKSPAGTATDVPLVEHGSLQYICSRLADAYENSTPGKWQRGRTSHHTVTESKYAIGEFHHACDAHFCDTAHELLPLLLAELVLVQDSALPTARQLHEASRGAAVATLEKLGYTYLGQAEWKQVLVTSSCEIDKAPVRTAIEADAKSEQYLDDYVQGTADDNGVTDFIIDYTGAFDEVREQLLTDPAYAASLLRKLAERHRLLR